jgi:hypothetical protein
MKKSMFYLCLFSEFCELPGMLSSGSQNVASRSGPGAMESFFFFFEGFSPSP